MDKRKSNYVKMYGGRSAYFIHTKCVVIWNDEKVSSWNKTKKMINDYADRLKNKGKRQKKKEKRFNFLKELNRL